MGMLLPRGRIILNIARKIEKNGLGGVGVVLYRMSNAVGERF